MLCFKNMMEQCRPEKITRSQLGLLDDKASDSELNIVVGFSVSQIFLVFGQLLRQFSNYQSLRLYKMRKMS